MSMLILYLIYHIVGNLGEGLLTNSVKIAKLKKKLANNIDYCMRAYGAKNSDRQI